MSLFQFLRENNGQYQFLVRGMTSGQLNRFQQILIDLVPTLAISVIEIEINSSSLSDTQLGNALGVVPFQSDQVLSFPYPSECTTEDECSVQYTLNVFCEHGPCDVTSGSLEPVTPTEVKPLYDDFLIVSLDPGQQIKLKVWVQKGNGDEHARFSPISLSRFQQMQEFVLNQRRFRGQSKSELTNILDICKKHQLKIDPRTGMYRLSRPNELIESGCPVDKLKSTDREEFLFTFASKGVLDLELMLEMTSELFADETGLDEPQILIDSYIQ